MSNTKLQIENNRPEDILPYYNVHYTTLDLAIFGEVFEITKTQGLSPQTSELLVRHPKLLSI